VPKGRSQERTPFQPGKDIPHGDICTTSQQKNAITAKGTSKGECAKTLYEKAPLFSEGE